MSSELREQIAQEVISKLMPLCVCARCDNIFEGRLIEEAVAIIRGVK